MLEVILHHLIVLVLFLVVLYFYNRYLEKVITGLLTGKKRVVVEYKKEESSRGE